MTKRDQLTLTLRARGASNGVSPGTLIASPKGRVVYRILEVTHVRRAGERGYRVRIVCARVSRADVPEGAKLLPWPHDRRAPRGSRRAADGSHGSADPRPPEPPAARIARIQAKAAAEVAQVARARRVGRDLGVVNRGDYGPGIRLESIRARDGALLREADVTVADTPDPDAPKVTRRRARRTDPLEVLKRAGTIDARGQEAGEKLRDAIERSQPSLPGVSGSEVRAAPWSRTMLSERQLTACQEVRRAVAAIDNVVVSAVMWILCDGGTIQGYAAFAHVRHTTVAELLRRGLGALADHYKLARPRAA